jgi:integrase
MEFVQPIRDLKQIETIKKILRQQNLRDYCLFVLGINSGLRISDLLLLRIKDVWDKGKIKDRIRLREMKTNKLKDFPISNSAKAALREYLKTRTARSCRPCSSSFVARAGTSSALHSLLAIKDYEPLFISRKGSGFLLRQRAYRILNDIARSVGIKEKIGTHTLRKTFGYHAYNNGYDITLIQKLFNHSSPSITLRYIGITQEQMDEVYLSLDL